MHDETKTTNLESIFGLLLHAKKTDIPKNLSVSKSKTKIKALQNFNKL